MNRNRNLPLAAALGTLLVLAAALPAAAQERTRIEGTVVDTPQLVLGFDSGKIDIRLTGASREADLASFATVAREKGEQALYKKVSAHELGRVSIDNGLGRPVAIVQESREEGIRRVLIVVPRDLSNHELFNANRSQYYPYVVIDVRYDADGNGDGSLYPMAKLKISPDGKLAYESLAAQPMQILRLRAS